MGLKESNEITVKIKCKIDEIYRILEEKGFKINHRFSMNDTYFISRELNLEKMTTREILSKAVLIRKIVGKTSGKVTEMITVKIKEFDDFGNITKQKSINCEVSVIEDAKRLLEAMGYKEIMNIKENDIVYGKDGFNMAIKDIENGDKLIEIETNESSCFDSVEKLIKRINEIQIPIYTDNFFVKKAEVELDKILKR